MKIKEGFRMRTLGRDHIVVAEGLQLINFNKMIVLNDTATYLWNEIQGKEFTAETLKGLLISRYDVCEDVAAADVEKLVKELTETGIVEE